MNFFDLETAFEIVMQEELTDEDCLQRDHRLYTSIEEIQASTMLRVNELFKEVITVSTCSIMTDTVYTCSIISFFLFVYLFVFPSLPGDNYRGNKNFFISSVACQFKAFL